MSEELYPRRRVLKRLTLAAGAATSLGVVRHVGADGLRLLHIDSYHQGNTWNDRIAAAVEAGVAHTDVQFRIFHMDSKRKHSEEEKRAAAVAAVDMIADYRPNVVTMSDDNAVKYVLMPYYRDAELPFVFCGLNWDASIYGLPYGNTTGMVEVSPIPQLIALLKGYASGPRLGFLAEDTPTKHKEKAFHEKLFGLDYHRAYFVSSFAEWQDAFVQAQDEVDILLLLGVGALTDWDSPAASTLAERETRIPTGTDFAWLMPYSLLGVAKLPEEQGTWAAKAALKILEGVPPSNIPVTHNNKGELLFNRRVAATLGIETTPPLARLVE